MVILSGLHHYFTVHQTDYKYLSSGMFTGKTLRDTTDNLPGGCHFLSLGETLNPQCLSLAKELHQCFMTDVGCFLNSSSAWVYYWDQLSGRLQHFNLVCLMIEIQNYKREIPIMSNGSALVYKKLMKSENTNLELQDNRGSRLKIEGRIKILFISDRIKILLISDIILQPHNS